MRGINSIMPRINLSRVELATSTSRNILIPLGESRN